MGLCVLVEARKVVRKLTAKALGHRLEPLPDQCARLVTEYLFGVGARVDDHKVGQPQSEKRAVRLDASRNVDRFSVAIRDVGCVNLNGHGILPPHSHDFGAANVCVAGATADVVAAMQRANLSRHDVLSVQSHDCMIAKVWWAEATATSSNEGEERDCSLRRKAAHIIPVARPSFERTRSPWSR